MPDLRHDPATGRWVAIAPERVERPGGAETPAADRGRRVPVLRRPRGPDASRDAPARRRADRLGRARRPEPVPGARTPGGRDPRAGARALRRRASRRDDRPRRRGLATPRGRRRRHLLSRSSTRDARRAPRCPTPTHSSPGCPHPRPRPSRSELSRTRVDVLRLDGVVAGCPVASRVPYELLIAPAEDGEGDWRRVGAARAGSAPARRARPPTPARSRRASSCRSTRGCTTVRAGTSRSFRAITRLAGLELGAGVYINPVEPEDAASRELAEA